MKDIVVILDAGHGEETQGKRSPILENGNRLLEWEFNRDICQRIYTLLQNENIKCKFMNPSKENVKLPERVLRIGNYCEMERKLGYHPIIISIHGNASGNGDWRSTNGWEVFCDPKNYGACVLAKCFKCVFNNIFPNKKLRGCKRSKFYITNNLNYPCVLTENFFYDNKDDCNLMMSEEGKHKISLLHVEAIKKYKNTLQ